MIRELKDMTFVFKIDGEVLLDELDDEDHLEGIKVEMAIRRL